MSLSMSTTETPLSSDTRADAGQPAPKPPRKRRTVGQRLLRLLTGATAVVVVVALLGVIYQAGASARDERRHPSPGVLLDVGGRNLHLWCSGSGSPTVVLESGLGGFSHDWSHLQPVIADQTRVCSYDRAGYGWSDSSDEPRGSTKVATDLRALLAEAGEEGPFIIVGHSIGGLHARSFARQYPGEVGAVVLVDSSHENQGLRLTMLDPLDEATRSGLQTCDRLSPFGFLRLLGAHGGAIPDSLDISGDTRAAWQSRLNQTRFCATVLAELDAIEADITQPSPPADLGDIPLIVLSSGIGATIEDAVDGVTEADLAEANRVMAELHSELAELSTNSTHRVIPDAGHYIHWDDPEAVTAAIGDAIDTWRASRPTNR